MGYAIVARTCVVEAVGQIEPSMTVCESVSPLRATARAPQDPGQIANHDLALLQEGVDQRAQPARPEGRTCRRAPMPRRLPDGDRRRSRLWRRSSSIVEHLAFRPPPVLRRGRPLIVAASTNLSRSLPNFIGDAVAAGGFAKAELDADCPESSVCRSLARARRRSAPSRIPERLASVRLTPPFVPASASGGLRSLLHGVATYLS